MDWQRRDLEIERSEVFGGVVGDKAAADVRGIDGCANVANGKAFGCVMLPNRLARGRVDDHQVARRVNAQRRHHHQGVVTADELVEHVI